MFKTQDDVKMAHTNYNLFTGKISSILRYGRVVEPDIFGDREFNKDPDCIETHSYCISFAIGDKHFEIPYALLTGEYDKARIDLWITKIVDQRKKNIKTSVDFIHKVTMRDVKSKLPDGKSESLRILKELLNEYTSD